MGWRWKIAQAAEIRWWQNYLKRKNPESYLQWKKQYWTDFMAKCELQPPKGASCLDAGCGPAGIFSILNEQQVDAVDPLLDRYAEKLDDTFIPDNYTTVNFHSKALEDFTPEKKYNYVFCLNAINHVSNWSASIATLFYCLAPKGTMVLSTDVHRHRFLKPVFRALPGDILHPHQHSLQDYLDELRQYKPSSIRYVHLKRERIFDYYALIIEQ